MSYISKHISQDEQVKYIAHKHWIVYFWPVVLIAFWGLGLLLLPLVWLSTRTTELGVTNKKVIAKWGIISRRTIEQRLEKVDSIQVHQGIIGRFLNYGTISVHGSGITTTPIPRISDPLQFRRAVESAIEGRPNVGVRT
jgi:uncharacterized membrane protein YdbT with pleckstrin-like domain